MKDVSSKNVLIITCGLIILFPMVTYLLALIFREYDIIPPVGSADAWIGFAGGIFGGSLTMAALYFTLLIRVNAEDVNIESE